MPDVPSRVLELIETFDRNIDAYKNQQYNEAQLRSEFIDPFFEVLGWDVTNKSGYAPAYKDVIHEDAIKIGGYTKAPDYCFRIGGARKFFLEAKKPSIDIKADPHPAYQLRRYAWSAKLPLSILTDFEEFAVYDCRIRPKQTDKSDTARIMYYTYKQYTDHWPDIENIFGKNAVLKGSFDKFAADTKAKRGTATVDKEFLADIENWREMLARTIALKNTSLTRDQINFAVQRTIDRIVFLRMCEDRGIEHYSQLLGLSTGRDTYARLCQLFTQADAKYNSGLFHFRHEKGRPDPDELTPNITIDDTPLKWILHNLYYPQSPYEFSVLPAEILGNVYEQFLGKVIRLTPAHQAKIEEKPEVKKAGGVYYTPAYIVDYIVKNTVGRLLHDPKAIPSQTVNVIPSAAEGSIQNCHSERSEESHSSIVNRKSQIENHKPLAPNQISKLKILDPACGSGSFLLGAYTYLLDYHRDWYLEQDPASSATGKYKKKIYQGKGAQWFLTIKEKKRILLNNIFGVDIDSQAVEVTKLSLLLKVLEGETAETVGQTYKFLHERALPDLADNIKCGNSLIGPDFFDNLDPSAPDDTNKELRTMNNEQQTILDDLHKKINPFDYKTEFPQVFKPKNPGFNAVIGNPPWGADIDKELHYFHQMYPDCVQKTTDSFKLFISKSLKLGANDCYISMIVPQTLLRQNRYSDVRSLLINFTINSLVDLGEHVFEKTVAPSSIFIVQKTQLKKGSVLEFLDLKHCSNNLEKSALLSSPDTIKRRIKQNLFLKLPDYAFIPNVMVSQHTWPNLGTIQTLRGKDAGINYQRVGVGMSVKGKSDLGKRLLYEGSREKQSHVMFWKGSDIGRYWILDETKRFCRPECKQNLRPNEVVRLAVDVYQKTPKILIRQTSDRILSCIDYKGVWFGRSILCIAPYGKDQHKLEYFLGLLNSKYINHLYQSIAGEKGRVFAQVKFAKLKQLPIRTIDFNNPAEKAEHDKMVKLADRMLDLHKKLTAAKIPAEKTQIQRQIKNTDKKIDQLTYELYRLTEEEIKIVEEST